MTQDRIYITGIRSEDFDRIFLDVQRAIYTEETHPYAPEMIVIEDGTGGVCGWEFEFPPTK